MVLPGEDLNGHTKQITEVDTLRRSIAQLEQALAGTSNYVDDVVVCTPCFSLSIGMLSIWPSSSLSSWSGHSAVCMRTSTDRGAKL